MAKTVFKTEEIELLDGSTVRLRPLSIRNMKKFQARFASLQEEASEANGDTDTTLEGLLDLAFLCLEQDNSGGDREELEDRLDLDSTYKVIEVCSGIKLNDPNLIAAANALLTE